MTYITHASGLPDPYREPEFYDGVLAKRGVAWAIDLALITAMTVLAGLLTLTVGFFLWPIFFVAIGLVYRVATLSGRSATWGMRLMGIELRGHDGARFETVQALLHVLGYYASVTFVLPALASIGTMMVTDRRQGLVDMLLGSAAINRPS